MSKTSFVDTLVHYVRAGGQAFFVNTAETVRCEQEIKKAAERLSKKTNLNVATWDAIDGLSIKEKTRDIQQALKVIATDDISGDHIFIFKNAHIYLSKVPEVRQAFKNIRERNLFNVRGRWTRPIIFLSNAYDIHPEIKHDLTILDFEPPTEEHFYPIVNQINEAVEQMLGKDRVCSPELREKIVTALLGMTEVEAENSLYFAVYRNQGFDDNILEIIETEKTKILGNDGILTYIPKSAISSTADLGGYDCLDEFVRDRKLAYTKEARAINLDYPRGIVLIGPPGTGKSVAGKTVAKILDLPLVIMDFSSVFNSLVGESESRLREALKKVRGLKQSVLLIDEADKAFQGQNDTSGVSQRLAGILLTWLTERPDDDRTFVVMTMNRTDGIRPETLRAGRFDRMFSTNMPTTRERQVIFNIHARKRGIDPLKYNKLQTDNIIYAMQDFVGAEIEQVIKDARFVSFRNRSSGTPTAEELIDEAKKVTPVSRLDPENLQSILQFCKGKTYPVSSIATDKYSGIVDYSNLKSARSLDLDSDEGTVLKESLKDADIN